MRRANKVRQMWFSFPIFASSTPLETARNCYVFSLDPSSSSPLSSVWAMMSFNVSDDDMLCCVLFWSFLIKMTHFVGGRDGTLGKNVEDILWGWRELCEVDEKKGTEKRWSFTTKPHSPIKLFSVPPHHTIPLSFFWLLVEGDGDETRGGATNCSLSAQNGFVL